MSNKDPWNNEEVLAPSKEELENLSPNIKKLFLDNLKVLVKEETRRCDCDCHYNPNLIHMTACCNQTYVQY
mgnify:CR=1 FL=1